MLSRSGVAVMGGIFTLGNFGATLGGETGSCFDGSVMRWQNSCSTPVSGLRTAFASKLYICLVALAYCALITAGCCCR